MPCGSLRARRHETRFILIPPDPYADPVLCEVKIKAAERLHALEEAEEQARDFERRVLDLQRHKELIQAQYELKLRNHQAAVHHAAQQSQQAAYAAESLQAAHREAARQKQIAEETHRLREAEAIKEAAALKEEQNRVAWQIWHRDEQHRLKKAADAECLARALAAKKKEDTYAAINKKAADDAAAAAAFDASRKAEQDAAAIQAQHDAFRVEVKAFEEKSKADRQAARDAEVKAKVDAAAAAAAAATAAAQVSADQQAALALQMAEQAKALASYEVALVERKAEEVRARGGSATAHHDYPLPAPPLPPTGYTPQTGEWTATGSSNDHLQSTPSGASTAASNEAHLAYAQDPLMLRLPYQNLQIPPGEVTCVNYPI